MWNEADIHFANFGWADYVRLQRIAKEELVKIDPAAKILTTGYACDPGCGHTDPDHVQKTLQDHQSYDVFAFHGHSYYSQYRRSIDLVTQTLNKLAPGKAWYSNETAINSVMVSEWEQGEQLFRKLLYTWAKGSIGYTWYDLRDDGFDPEYTEHHFGMLTHDFYPKAVYAVFNTLAKRLTGAKFLTALSREPEIEGYLFRARNGDLYYGFWGWQPGTTACVLKNVTGRASLVDLFGNESFLAVRDGCVILPADTRGKILRLRQAERLPELAFPVVAPEHLPLTVEPGQTEEKKFTLYNPLSRRAAVGWRISAVNDVKVANAEFQTELAPGEKREVLIRLQISPQTVELPPEAVIMETRLDGVPVARSPLPVAMVRNVVRQDQLPAQPHFVLDQARHVFQTTMAPEALWSGPRDCAGKIALARYGDELYVRVDVRDDLFCQPYVGASGWMGDNVQLFLALPGRAGFWEFGITKSGKGVQNWCYNTPVGLKRFSDFKSRITPLNDGRLCYEAWFPLAKLGFPGPVHGSSFRFNCFINDNDGKGRKGYLGISTDKDPARYPLLRFR